MMQPVERKEDNRGEILKYLIDGKTILLIYTKKGFLRAGEVHNVVQHALLLHGEVDVITKIDNKDYVTKYMDMQFIMIPQNVPHYFKFLKNSVMMETQDENMTTTYYPEYRKLVEESMK